MNEKRRQEREEQKPEKRFSPGIFWYNLVWLFLLFLGFLWLRQRALSTSEMTLIDYSTFRQQVQLAA